MLKHHSLVILILLLGTVLRFHALRVDARFHPDEALFATFARKAAVNGDWMLHGSLDKTPLSIYAQAISIMLVGASPLANGVLTLDVHAGEFAARVPGTLASILLIPLTYPLARQFYGKKSRTLVPLIAMFLMAVSPYALAFSATTFTDGLMLLCITLALWSASHGGWIGAGVWIAVGYACKQQALLYVPLVVIIAYLKSNRTWRALLFRFAGFVLPLLIGFGLLTAWDNARAQDTPLLALAVMNNDPGRLIYPEQALPRLQTWISYAGNLLGAGWMTAILLSVGMVAAIKRIFLNIRDHSTQLDLILLGYIVGYGLIHWLVALPTHDRYLLPIILPVSLLVGRGLNKVFDQSLKRTRHVVSLQKRFSLLPKIAAPLLIGMATLCFLPSAIDATQGRIALGGDRGQHAGIDRLGAYLNSKTLGAIVYDHWLGWELGYYLGTWSNKRLTYYPNPQALVADAIAQDDPAPRYFPVPRNVPVEPWLDRLGQAGFQIARDYESEKFIVYRLIPPS
jgi:4-amino-4-deoxy-L-arabinose transferase-like glycosyltransferase